MSNKVTKVEKTEIIIGIAIALAVDNSELSKEARKFLNLQLNRACLMFTQEHITKDTNIKKAINHMAENSTKVSINAELKTINTDDLIKSLIVDSNFPEGKELDDILDKLAAK